MKMNTSSIAYRFARKVVPFCMAVVASVSLLCAEAKLEKKQLQNNIPVYIEKNDSNRIYAVYIVVKGGIASLTPDKSGLENALFTMMTRGSKAYSYKDIQSILFKTKASVYPSSLEQGSVLGLSCIDYYFDTMLPVLTDGFMNPAYGKEEYDTLMNEYMQKLQSIKNDPSSLLEYNAAKEIYKGHPYETMTGVTDDSIANITVENMKSLHQKLLDANRISVVAVGNFDEDALVTKLNETLGTIPALETKIDQPDIPPVAISGAPVVYTHPNAEGTGFVGEVFTSPSVTSDDYVASCITANMYSELLYNIVREKYGACYSPSSSVLSSKAPVGIVYIYKASDLEHIKQYVAEAQSLMAEGKIIAGKNDDGTYAYTTIADRREGYINSYLNGKYEDMVTNGGVAGKIAGSILQFDDPEKYLSVMESAKKVTADDIERVFQKYWCTDNVRWFATVGPSDKEKMESYLK